ncbi:MAG: 30S ribosomal protein S1 [Ignavibacteriaceae bacterium]|jgi:small subunit ribosomal protein S1|nr:30S ribosomal protein S1 [Chlorobium sp.]MCW8816996.1 30S ribosomal protein S1 [Ignavibacteriaceae bacterium]MCW9094766.1 30S ribosomal protein S1 [Ignavibacteriaceae bacterium]
MTADVQEKTTNVLEDFEKAKNKFDTSDYTQEEFEKLANLYTESFRDVKQGELVKGRLVRIQDDNVIIDVGFKSEGTIPRSEFSEEDQLQVGQEVEVVLESVEDQEGNLVLSKARADFLRIWQKVLSAHETGDIIQGKIIKRIKGGMVVDLIGMEAFLPGSQIDIRPIRDFDALVGQTMDFKVVKVNIPTENVVVSHKVLIEEEISDQRKAILESLERGQILEGVVKAITDFGVFVDLGGVDGLIHITDLSWGRINHPSEIVKLDETLKIVVTDFDEAKKRISLSLKKLLPHPWENIEEKYKIGDKVSGRVVSLTDYGAFIEIEKGIEGLIHNSEMSWTQHIKHPSQVVAMGQIIEAVILSLDKEEKKISLGIKQLEPDPWQTLMIKYPVGSRHTGIARNLTNFGVFVELEPGVDGLVHISDLSWTKKIRHPGEVVKKGESLEVTVLGVDVDSRKISLGHKQIMENPWDTFEQKFSIGTITEGKVVRIIEKGLIAELPEGVDGFVPANQLSTSKLKNFATHFPVDDVIPVKVIEFDKTNKKIVLSTIAALKDKNDNEIEDYLNKHKLDKVSIESIKSAETGAIDSSEFPIFEVHENPEPKKKDEPQ